MNSLPQTIEEAEWCQVRGLQVHYGCGCREGVATVTWAYMRRVSRTPLAPTMRLVDVLGRLKCQACGKPPSAVALTVVPAGSSRQEHIYVRAVGGETLKCDPPEGWGSRST